MTPTYNLHAVRRLLTAAFSASEITSLAFDLFHAVYDDFTSGMSKAERIERLVAYAARHGRIPGLLAYVEKENPHQYGRFVDQLTVIPSFNPPRQSEGSVSQEISMSDFLNQRLRTLANHIEREQKLLVEYEEDSGLVDDPRRKLRNEREINRQKEAIKRYQQEMAELKAAMSESPAANQPEQAELASLNQKVEGLSQQIAETERRLTAGQTAIRDDLAAQRQAIIDRVDLRYRETMRWMTNRLDGQQLQMIELLQTAVNQQQLAQTEAQTLNQQTQAALLALRQAQPDAAQWQNMLDLLDQAAGWEQKVKLALPLIPGILSFESEIKLDALPPLNQTWRRLVAKFRQP